MGAFGIIIICLCLFGFGYKVYSMFDHWSNTKNLKAGAKIIDFQQKSLNNYIKTTVKFDDGFTYVTFKTNRRSGGYKRVILYTEKNINLYIATRAIEKHEKLLAKKEERLHSKN